MFMGWWDHWINVHTTQSHAQFNAIHMEFQRHFSHKNKQKTLKL